MRERPILFGAPMVRAILQGRKTQTRRVVKPQPHFDPSREQWSWENKAGRISWSGAKPQTAALIGARDICPFGSPGDRLWVRETWGLHAYGDFTYWMRDSIAGRGHDDLRGSWEVAYLADAESPYDHWRPSIYMPRWASRLTLEVIGVHVERLQDISEEDAKAEGVEPYTPPHGSIHPDQRVPGPGFDRARLGDQPHRLPFADLWDSINAKRAPWCSNPFVWVVSFKTLSIGGQPWPTSTKQQSTLSSGSSSKPRRKSSSGASDAFTAKDLKSESSRSG